MKIIPTVAVANQTFATNVANQACQINIYTKVGGLYFDLYVGVDRELIAGGIICQNEKRLVRFPYLGFIGDFAFVDTQGNTDPVYTGLGSRYQFVYLEADDLVT